MAKLAAAETRLKRQAVQATMREAIIDVSAWGRDLGSPGTALCFIAVCLVDW